MRVNSGEPWRLGRRPALDGLRGVAILLVLVGHSGPVPLQPVAWVGVTLFFGLSGFLITALLLEERADYRRINLAAFWRRRAIRLLPALFLMLAATGAFLTGAGFHVDPFPVVAYYGNWVQATGGDLDFWRHTWSLSIEEQFYVVWPLIVVVLPTRRAVTIACLLGIGWSVGATVVLGSDFARVYNGTDTRMWTLLLGCLIAARLVGTTRQLPASPPWLSAKPLRWLGRRSYGIYLWHYPLTLLMPPLVGIALGGVIAELSWRYVEQPLTRRSGRLVGAVDREVVPRRPRERARRAEHVRRADLTAVVEGVGNLERGRGTGLEPSTGRTVGA